MIWVFVFGAVFAIAGAVTVYRGAVAPYLQRRDAARWVSSPCTVTKVAVAQRADGDGGRQYAPRVTYTYEAEGRLRHGDRISFGDGLWSNDRDRAARAAGHYRVGQTITCFYDPRDPGRVVLERSVPGGTGAAMVGLGFVLVGLGIIATELRDRRRARRLAAPPTSADAPPQLTRLGDHGLDHLLFAGGFAAAFTAPVPFLITETFEGVGYFAMSLLFGAIALGLQLWFWHRLLRAIGPRITVAVDRAPRLEAKVTITVELRGWMPIRSARVRLLGREEATHRVGTDTVTDTDVFFEREVAAVRRPGRAARLTGTVALPGETMPTWSANSNRVRWVIAIDADIATWPDVTDEYEVLVEAGADGAQAES